MDKTSTTSVEKNPFRQVSFGLFCCNIVVTTTHIRNSSTHLKIYRTMRQLRSFRLSYQVSKSLELNYKLATRTNIFHQ
ncbi:hypothetical protein C8Q75DRAFT_502842 [Abortiporus biennis]|nr:hypothetical protein C8Q75DRAFT_502842 [Abortiporus biennis]